MKLGRNLIPWTLAVCALTCLHVGSAAAAPFSQMIVFGDSLSDVGNIAQATLDIYPGPYYYNDRFSNGPVFIEALSTGLGLGPPARSTAGGNAFAYGGAQTSNTGGIVGLFIRDIDEQVDQFFTTRTAGPDALFLVFAGSNDLVNGQTNVNIPVANLAKDIGRLAAAGARNFLVPNLPLLGHTPRYNDNPATLAQYNDLATRFNHALEATLDNLEKNTPASTFFRLDVAALFGDALANPGAFGLTNVTDAAAPGLQPGTTSYDTDQIAPNANQYLFWDDLHPTATVHAALAQRALALFVTPGDYNRDDIVDAADYVVWRDAIGQSGAGLAADGNGNGEVDPLDYQVWRLNFGRMTETPASDGPSLSATMPEPRSGSQMWLAIAGILGSRSWRWRATPSPRLSRRHCAR